MTKLPSLPNVVKSFLMASEIGMKPTMESKRKFITTPFDNTAILKQYVRYSGITVVLDQLGHYLFSECDMLAPSWTLLGGAGGQNSAVAGNGGTRIAPFSPSQRYVFKTGGAGYHPACVTFQRLAFDGSIQDNVGTNVEAIRIGGAVSPTIDSCLFQKWGVGVSFIPEDRILCPNVEKSRFLSCEYGIKVDGNGDDDLHDSNSCLRITGNTMDYGRYPIYLNPGFWTNYMESNTIQAYGMDQDNNNALLAGPSAGVVLNGRRLISMSNHIESKVNSVGEMIPTYVIRHHIRNYKGTGLVEPGELTVIGGVGEQRIFCDAESKYTCTPGMLPVYKNFTLPAGFPAVDPPIGLK